MKYLTIDDVCDMLSISRRTLERMRKDPLLNLRESLSGGGRSNWEEGFNIGSVEFPKPDLLIGRSPRWEQEKLILWLQKNGSHLQT